MEHDDIYSIVINAFIFLLIMCMIVATLVGNAFVIIAVLIVRKLKKPPNLLLISLAVSDFCVGLIVMPLAMIDLFYDDWILGQSVCRLWTSADLTLCTASIINLCMISIDRYCAVSRPLRYTAQRTTSLILLYIAIVWITALIVSISPIVLWPTISMDRSCQVNQNPIYQIYATIIAFYGPTLIMITLYAKVWMAAKRLTDKDRIMKIAMMNHTEPDKTGAKGKYRLSRPLFKFLNVNKLETIEGKGRKTLGVIMSVFIICWVPFFLIALLKPHGIVPPSWLDSLSLWLGYSNSLLNPLIYCMYNSDFRTPFREMICCRFRTLHSVMREESFKIRYGPISRRSTRQDENVANRSLNL